jgi:hypothetical protein
MVMEADFAPGSTRALATSDDPMMNIIERQNLDGS